jgi:xanthine dehydrogenase YagR molybdenum-binding subunit
MEVVFLNEDDPNGSPLGSKGIGELGICGAGAAVINAIHNATSSRIRNFPATPESCSPRWRRSIVRGRFSRRG